MEAWWSGAEKLPFVHPDGGSYTSGPFKGVLHTTESKKYWRSTSSYYGHRNPPHFTVFMEDGVAKAVQHYPITRASRALKNLSGGVQTNRDSAIQVEIAWRAAEAATMPGPLLVKVRDLMRWAEVQAGIRRTFWNMVPANSYVAANQAGHRMSFAEWNGWDGWCVHSDVPENTHWDTGRINTLFLLGTEPSPPSPPPSGGNPMAGITVKMLQDALNLAGQTDYENKALLSDGVWGRRTQSAWVKGLAGGGGGTAPVHNHDSRYAMKSHPHTIN